MAENDAPELKPCPFCGSEAAFKHEGLGLDPAFDGDVYGRVYCTEGRFRCCPELQYEPNEEDEQKAFEEWNTRADLAAPNAAQDGLWSDLELVVECIDIPLPQKDSIITAIRRTQAKFPDAVRQAQRETWEAAIQIAKEEAFERRMAYCVFDRLKAAALRAEEGKA